MSITAETANIRLLAAGLLGGLGVSMGAFGSHAFLNKMDVSQKRLYDVANQYHIIHCAAMAVVSVAAQVFGPRSSTGGNAKQSKLFEKAYGCFLAGSAIVATSRYVHCVVHKPAWLAKVAPVGGLVLAAGWGFVVAAGYA